MMVVVSVVIVVPVVAAAMLVVISVKIMPWILEKTIPKMCTKFTHLSTISIIIKSRRKRWAGHVAQMCIGYW
jgi:hypothetical protein